MLTPRQCPHVHAMACHTRTSHSNRCPCLEVPHEWAPATWVQRAPRTWVIVRRRLADSDTVVKPKRGAIPMRINCVIDYLFITKKSN